MGEPEEPREGKVVYTGVLTGSHSKAEENDELPDVDQVYQVTIRSIDKKGNVLLFPEVEVEVYWTNLYEKPQMIINLYHDHGTS
ncbi:MAG: IS1380 family transposase, partial [Spirochaetaceae bacterium]|nr:IS1380 family transposase [Spirochaetaceae bacterium]